MKTDDYLNSEENILVDANGERADLSGRMVQEGSEGSLQLTAAGCVISFVNCTTKKTQVVSLKKGDTFFYGDWNGSRCIRKTYTC